MLTKEDWVWTLEVVRVFEGEGDGEVVVVVVEVVCACRGSA